MRIMADIMAMCLRAGVLCAWGVWLCGCRQLGDMAGRLSVPTNAVPSIVPPAAPVAEWGPSHYAEKWMVHGYEGEDLYRERMIDEARGKFLKYPFIRPRPDALTFELLHWRHPTRGTAERPYYSPRNWSDRALNAGVRGFVVVLPDGYDRENVRDCYKDMPDTIVQFIRAAQVVGRVEL